MVERAQLVRHGVAHAQKCVGEGHTGHAGGVCHVLAGFGVLRAVFVGGGQVLENQLQTPQRQTVGVVRGHHGGVGFQGVGHGVDAGGRGQTLGGVHHHVGVHDGHFRQQLVVRQRILDAGGFIGDDGEGSHLGAGTGGGGDGDEIRLFAHLGEGVDTLADIHEAHGHVLEIRLGMLIQHPHDLARVHGGAAADGENQIGLEGRHLRRALSGTGEGGIGSYVVEGGMGNPHSVQLLLHRLRVAVLVQERVGDDECLLVIFQLGQSYRQAALLEINLFRRTEPEHVLPPNCHSLDVQQVLDAHVLGNGVAAPGAAAQRQGGSQLEVVQVADAAVGGRSIHQNAAGFHFLRKGVQLLLPAHRVQINGSCVAVAAILDKGVRLVHGVGEVGRPVHGKHGGQLLMGKSFGEICGGHFTDEDFGAFGDVNARQRRDGMGGLTNNFGVQRTVNQDGCANLVDFFRVQDVAAALDEFRLDPVVDAVQHHHALLGGADHTVVEGLGVNDGGNRQQNVGAVVDHSGGIAGADAQSGFAGGVSCLHHAGTAGGEDQVGLPHHLIGQLQRRLVDPRDDAFRCAGGDRRFQNHPSGSDGAALRSRMGADDDAVAGLQGDQGLEDGSGSGVRGGNDRRDDADRLGNALNAVGRVFLNDTAGLGILVGVVNIFSGIVVLDDLILHYAHTGFGYGLLGQRNAHLIGCGSGGQKNFIHLLLRISGKFLLCRAALCQCFGQFLGSGYGCICFIHKNRPFRILIIGISVPIYCYRYNSTYLDNVNPHYKKFLRRQK